MREDAWPCGQYYCCGKASHCTHRIARAKVAIINSIVSLNSAVCCAHRHMLNWPHLQCRGHYPTSSEDFMESQRHGAVSQRIAHELPGKASKWMVLLRKQQCRNEDSHLQALPEPVALVNTSPTLFTLCLGGATATALSPRS